MNVVECANLFYFNNINSIGGVESFFYYLVKKYNDIDILIVYKSSDPRQLKRLNKYVRTLQFNSQRFKCDKAFFNYDTSIIDYVTAREYVQIIHADYKYRKLLHLSNALHPKISRFLGVSRLACESFESVMKKPCELCYNPLSLDAPKKVIRLVSATRLTQEKGYDDMLEFASCLERMKQPYLWLVFTNDSRISEHKYMITMPPNLDITPFIADADFLVQLSTCESFSYSVVESLSLNTPVIVKNLPVFHEIGLNDKNSIIIDDVNDITQESLLKEYKFTYTPPEDNWNNILVDKKTSYVPPSSNFYTVVALTNFTLKRFNEIENLIRRFTYRNEDGWLYEGDMFDCSKEMYEYLIDIEKFGRALVKLVDV